jgi:hypothetical protein
MYSKTKDRSVIVKISVFMLMFIPAALRYNTGTDYLTYQKIFNLISSGYKAGGIEYGYVAINKISAVCGFGFRGVITITSFLTLFFVFISVERKSFWVVIFVYYTLLYTASFNTIRQALAIAMAYYSYQLINNRKILKSFLLIFAASLFHRSVLLYYPVFLLMLFAKINKKRAVFLLVLSIAVKIFSKPIVDWLFDVAVSQTPYASYAKTMYNIPNENSILFDAVHYFIFSTVIFLMPDIKTKSAGNAYCFYTTLNFVYVLGGASGIFNRLNYLFLPAWFPLLHQINIYHSKYRKVILLIVLFWVLASFIASVGLMGSYDVVPYKSIFWR